MLIKLIPVLMALVGLGAGLGGGLMLRPLAESGGASDAEEVVGATVEDETTELDGTHVFVKLNNQFVIPIVEEGRVNSLVVMSLSLMVPAGRTEGVYEVEPKLRDVFLRVMFDHANTGGFSGAFTKSTRMNTLRAALRESAQKLAGGLISDVLIIDIMRQDT